MTNLQEGVYITTGEGEILDANPAFLRMLGVGSLRQLRRFSAETLLVDPRRRQEELKILARNGAVREFELEIRRPDGEIRTVLDTAYQVREPESGRIYYHGILVDISDRKELETRLREAAVRDALTGCFNRRYLADTSARLERQDARWGVILADIDHFKRYNDLHGHDTGDRVLIRVARYLMGEVRAGDDVVRFGGDEFLVVLSDPAGDATGEVAERITDRAQKALPVSFSLGWAVRQRRESVEATIRRADKSLIHVRVRERRYRNVRKSPDKR